MGEEADAKTRSNLIIVDDEEGVADFIRDVAEECGFDVTICNSGGALKEQYPNINPAVIILDLNLPGYDGVELLRYLSEQHTSAKIIISSGADQRTIAAAQELGTRHQLNIHPTPLMKPLDVDMIEEILIPLRESTSAIAEGELRNALNKGEFVTYFQPKVDLLDNDGTRLDGVEALVRWKRPDNGIICPDHFIPLMQKHNLMGELTDVVIEQSIAAAHAWKEDGLDITVSINLDGSLLDDVQLPDRIHQRALAMGVEPQRLTMEVTETAAMADTFVTMEILTRLRVKGFNVSMDDFGTGYSSLVQLYRLPFNELKIDKSFVMDIGRKAEAEIIVEILALLGRKLGIRICAEGIETEGMLNFVKKCGCHLGQGYLFSRPIEQSMIAKLARRYGVSKKA